MQSDKRGRAWRRHQRERTIARREKRVLRRYDWWRSRVPFSSGIVQERVEEAGGGRRGRGAFAKRAGFPVQTRRYGEKNYKLLYLRSEKVNRAKQLGEHLIVTPSPRVRGRDPVAEPLNVLFICSRNQWRSPTAEKVFRRRPGLAVRSAGVSDKARHKVTHDDLRWADVVCVMEEKHRQRLVTRFPGETQFLEIHVLGIPDDYKFMDPELVQELEQAMEGLLRTS